MGQPDAVSAARAETADPGLVGPRLRGGVYRGAASSGLPERLRAAGWTVAHVPPVGDRAEALAAIGVALDFPAYYGRNLDALHDCLRDVDAPTALVWPDWATFALAAPEAWSGVLSVLRERGAAQPPFALVLPQPPTP